MATGNFPTPAPMDMKGDIWHNWAFFRAQFENYEIATGQSEIDETVSVAALLSIMRKVCFRVYPLAHRAKRGARVLISTCVESFYTRDE